MSDALDEKIERLLRPLLGDKGDRLFPAKLHRNVIRRIQQAHAEDLGRDDASRLGMHMSDWIGDAAFLIALHLLPDEFSDEEIRDGMGKFSCMRRITSAPPARSRASTSGRASPTKTLPRGRTSHEAFESDGGVRVTRSACDHKAERTPQLEVGEPGGQRPSIEPRKQVGRASA